MGTKFRLIVMNFLQFAVWGAYLTSMGTYLVGVGQSAHIGMFYAMQGIVSMFMPALVGIVADRWDPRPENVRAVPPAGRRADALGRVLRLPRRIGRAVHHLFTLYSFSVAFYMPTLALSNSVAYSVLESRGLDTIKAFPPIRVFGTIGFICSMLLVDAAGFQATYSPIRGVRRAEPRAGRLRRHPARLPDRSVGRQERLRRGLGLKAFALFKEKKMALFFVFRCCWAFLADHQRLCQPLHHFL